jgi:hypothetical protein
MRLSRNCHSTQSTLHSQHASVSKVIFASRNPPRWREHRYLFEIGQGPTVPKVFLSYRRGDSQSITDRIYERLVRHFSKSSVFKDVDDLALGADFREQIDDAIGGADVVLAIIGPGWVNASDSSCRRRLENRGDFVRIEL